MLESPFARWTALEAIVGSVISSAVTVSIVRTMPTVRPAGSSTTSFTAVPSVAVSKLISLRISISVAITCPLCGVIAPSRRGGTPLLGFKFAGAPTRTRQPIGKQESECQCAIGVPRCRIFKASMGISVMTSFEKFNVFAALRGDGLHPRLRDLLDSAAMSPFSDIKIRHDGMRQSGPNPRSEMPGSGNIALLPREKCPVEAEPPMSEHRKLLP